jgi:peptide/nickel transport system ATP-binding protein
VSATADDPVLEIRGLHVDLPVDGDRPYAVEAVDLVLHRNEILCLVGESGSGKSLTARAVMGLLPAPRVFASAGQIWFGGEDLLAVSEARLREVRGSEISMIFQEPMTALNPLMTIGEQIDEVVDIHTDLAPAARRQRVLDLLRDVHLPDPAQIIAAYPHQLSGGQRQRAMIAMALILEPKVLVADEPTTITHDFGVVAEIADRVAVMQHGKLVEAGPAERVLNRPRHPYTRSLIAAVPSLVPAKARPPEADAPTVLAVRALRKEFRTGGGLFGRKGRAVTAAKDVNLELRRGATLGIVGESGSGKTTVARCIVRLVEADGGQILLDGTDLLAIPAKRLRPHRKRIQMVFQDPYGSLNPRHKVGQLIAAGPMVHGVRPDVAYARALELLDLVGLDPKVADRYPHEFSGGQRQRIGIARALALDPEVLVADEPVSALDVSVQAQVLRLLADIRDRLNLSMLFITHDLRVAAQVCDSIAVMRQLEPVDAVHHPRPARRRPGLRLDRRDAPRRGGRIRPHGDDLRRPAARVHEGTVRLGPGPPLGGPGAGGGVNLR